MQSPFNNIVQQLFHQPSLHSVTVDELENMANQHPYFAAAHFLLLKKMQDSDHPQFNTQLHKTTLYFNNPLWLQFLLQPEIAGNFTVSEKAPFINNEPEIPAALAKESETNNMAEPAVALEHEEPAANNETAQQEAHSVADGPVYASADTSFPHNHSGIMDVITEVFNEPADQTIPPVFEKEDNNASTEIYTGSPAATETVEAAIEENTHAVSEETIGTTDEPAVFEKEDNSAHTEIHTAEMPAAAETAEAGIEENTHVVSEETIGATNEPASGDIAAGESPAENDNHFNLQPDTRPEPFADATAAPDNQVERHAFNNTDDVVAVSAEHATVASETAENKPPQNAAEITETPAVGKEEAPLFKMVIETAAAKNDFLFEPYHTVDYFASQGIKLSKAETASKDNFGRQLKSFTEWLKTMKKLPKASIEKMLSENEESKVVADAIHSIENKEVITEAMAEVFEKQGMTEKAVEVYQKLSLLNPGKSAYFAAKIEDLKH